MTQTPPDDAVVLEDFEEMVDTLWGGTPSQQILARTLTEPVDIETLADLLTETES